MRNLIFAEETRKWFTLAAVSFGLFMSCSTTLL
jgi:hypothetical protein